MNKEITVSEYDKDLRKEHRLILRSYAAFLSAIVITIITKPLASEFLWAILSLLSVSIPSAIGSVNVERFTEYGRENNPKWLYFTSMILVYIPSITAISIMIGTVSVIAAATFATASVAWFITIVKLRNSSG